jgi:hypothetical protein
VTTLKAYMFRFLSPMRRITISVARQLRASIVLLIVAATPLYSQTAQVRNGQEPSGRITITIERQLVHFASTGEQLELRLVVSDHEGGVVFDSGYVNAVSIDWPFTNQQGEALASGIYNYTLSTKAPTDEAPRTHQGQVIVDRASGNDRVWLIGSPQTGLGADSQASKFVVLGSNRTAMAGTELPAEPHSAIGEQAFPQRSTLREAGKQDGNESARLSGPSVFNISGTGTTNLIPRWTNGTSGVLGNSNIADVNGKVGIGTMNPLRLLQLGPSTDALFTLEPTDGSPNAGYIRFGDNTGWKLHIGRSKEQSSAVGGTLNTGTTGVLLTIQDNGYVGLGTTTPAARLDVRSTDLFPTAAVNATGGVSSLSTTNGGVGVHGIGGYASNGGNSGIGIMGEPGYADFSTGSNNGWAGFFTGDVWMQSHVTVDGTLYVTGSKNFKIDHPLDPENKYLLHAAIESSEVLNVYSGNITLGQDGKAVVTLPDWFEALNRDFRYQLTAIGGPAQGLYIAEEVKGNQFRIAGGVPRMKVSWQVTAVRSDAVMRQRPFKAEEDKAAGERGTYLTPEAFGQPEERSMAWGKYPELMREMKQRREQAQKRKAQAPNQ